MKGLLCTDQFCEQKQGLAGRYTHRGYLFQNRWYCSLRCLNRAMNDLIQRDLNLPGPQILQHRKSRIGTILMQKGLISREELEEVLSRQSEVGGSVGEWLQKMNHLTDSELTAALSEQQGVPWLAELDHKIEKDALDLVPRKICVEYGIVPFEFSHKQDLILVGVKSPIDVTMIHVLRRMLGSDIRAFLVPDRFFVRLVEEYLAHFTKGSAQETHCTQTTPLEISEIMVGQAKKQKPHRILISFFDETFWVRFQKRRKWRDFFIYVRKVEKVSPADGQTFPNRQLREG